MDIVVDILLGDAPTRTGSVNLTQVDIVFARHLPDQRRKRTGIFGRRRGLAEAALVPVGLVSTRV